MSKIGQKPILINNNINLKMERDSIEVAGPKGNIMIKLPRGIKLEKQDNQLLVKTTRSDKKTKAFHGLMRSLIYNAVIGVEKPWTKDLEIVGTGYRVKLVGQDLQLELGFSHPVIFSQIDGIEFIIKGNNKITVSGADKELVGRTAFQIKSLKKPDPYKGKGIRYQGEKIKLKPGKKAITTS